MRKIALLVILAAAISFTASAGPKEEAQAVADRFIKAFVAGDLEATTALFAPQALFWGTNSPDLGTAPDAVRKYFVDSYAPRATTPLIGANIVESSVSVLSDETVLIAGRWQVERPSATSHLRFTFVMHKADGQWRILHLHSSQRPRPQ